MQTVFSKPTGRPIGLSAAALRFWGNRNPKLMQLAAKFAKARDIQAERERIVRRAQLDNLTKK